MPDPDIRLGKAEPNNNERIFLVLVFLAMLVAALGINYATHDSEPDDDWTPYSFESFERVEMTVYDIDAAENDPTYITRWKSVELGKYEYETLTELANHDPHMRPFINKALADGKVTRGEFQEIQVENDEQWSRYNKRELEQTKKGLAEVSKK